MLVSEDLICLKLMVLQFNLSFSVLGDSVCGICVFRCSIHTEVHSSHSVGVSDHFVFVVAVCAQAQQETDFLLLASHCG